MIAFFFCYIVVLLFQYVTIRLDKVRNRINYGESWKRAVDALDYNVSVRECIVTLF